MDVIYGWFVTMDDIARFLDRMCLALRASGLWLRYAMLQSLIPSFPGIAPPRPPPWHTPRKGRDQILPSGNTVSYLNAAVVTAEGQEFFSQLQNSCLGFHAELAIDLKYAKSSAVARHGKLIKS